jgi:hypothetical protein
MRKDDLLDYQEFKNSIIGKLQEYLGEEVELDIHQIQKNNGIYLDGISISRRDKNIAPTLYLNDYYRRYREGVSILSIVEDMIVMYEESKIKIDVEVEFFTDFETAKDHIVYKLINYEKNEDLIQEVPHIVFLDLAIVFYCVVKNHTIGSGTILIHNHHTEFWGTETEELFELAKCNSPKLLPEKFQSMDSIMRELCENVSINEEILNMQEEGVRMDEERITPMYVLSNNEKILGAACILYEEVLFRISRFLDSDLYILPSSIHECILLPTNFGYTAMELREMVSDINETQVKPEEVLSNAVYRYIKDENLIMME